MKLKKCSCGYTLKDECEKCGETKEAHYKFVKIRDVWEVGKARPKK